MIISGITTFTGIDFPGELACVVFTPGCNFRCPYCHNSQFVLPEKIKEIKNNFIPEEAVFNFLQARKEKLSGVSICGGEPTLQPGLYDFCKKVKDLGYKIKLDTNGRDPEILEKLINDNLIDYFAMDIKQEIGKFSTIAGKKVDEEKYKKSIDIIKNSPVNYEFRTTIVKGIHTEENIENIAKYISGAKAYYLQNFKNISGTLKEDFDGKSFTQKELEHFQKIASKYIKNVGIRN